MELKDSTDTANSSAKDSGERPRCGEAFRLKALDRMMDGVLEIRWEDDLKRDVPKPECLSKDPSKFTEEDLVAIKRYEERLRTLKSDRLKYKAILEDQIVQTQEATWSGVKAFNETLTDLHWRKIEADRSILRDKLIRARACLRHGAVVRKRKKIARLLREESDPGTKEARRLQEECASVEPVIAELKTRYDSLLKREKLLEGKFRSEFPELKQPMVEHLFRHYKRRPRMARATCTSVTFLIQLAKCVVNILDHRDVLPRECLDFLRGLDNLDAMPDGLPPQIEASHWQAMCKLRRVKIETEIKVKRCAVEIAEAEQTLSIFQKACLHSRGKVSRCKDTLQDLQRSLSVATTDSEIRLVLKTGQVEVRVAGRPSDFDNAVLVQREELLRVNAAIAQAGARKLRVLEKSIELRKRIVYEEWKHACAKAKLNTLQEDLEDLKAAKITRLCRECTWKYPDEAIPDEEENARERNLIAMKDRLREAAEEESRRSRSLETEIIKWRRKNERLDKEIEKRRAEIGALVTVTREPSRLREIHFRRLNMIAITRLAYLERQIRENMEDLLTLKGTLEVFKLRTYPTLSFHG